MTTMSEKQRQAVEALEAARREGVSLTAYAKTKGLVISELYNTLAGLRRKGHLPRPIRKPRSSNFIAVRVERPSPVLGRAPGSGTVVCRIVHAEGYLIECTQWPPPNWLNALTRGSKDAAT
jgi:hypothetical protein